MTTSDPTAGLTIIQNQAAEQTGPALVLAGAGTGKTKTLTAAAKHRITKLGIPLSQILAVTFTNKSAREMRERIQDALGEQTAAQWIGTFHGLAARQLRIEPEVAGLRAGFDILDADDTKRIIRRVLKALNLATDDEDGAVGRDSLKAMCNRIAQFKDSLITPEEAPARIEAMISETNRSGLPIDAAGLRATAQVYARYQDILRETNAADFGDLLLWVTKAMQKNAAYRKRWQDRFRALLCDEFQDVNLAQFTWLRLLAAEHRELFVVGDDDQAIYSWRGADVRFLRRFEKEFPGATVIRLEENFRSTSGILKAANAVIAQDTTRLGKTLFTRKGEGHPVEIVSFRNPETEATEIAAEITRRHAAGVKFSDMAICYRASSVSRNFEEALMRARIPHVLVGDVGFWQRAEIKDALAMVRLATNPDDAQSDEAFRRVINTPTRGFGTRAMEAVEREATTRKVSLLNALATADLTPKTKVAGLTFANAIRSVGRNRSITLADQISLLLEATGYREMLQKSRAETTEGRLENLHELIFLAGSFHTARELLDHSALSTGGPDKEDTERVSLMTLHKAKGLEYPHIFLPAWEQGVFPPSYGDPYEERRIAHVALTRAMLRVTISHCEYRRGPARPSQFIADIPENVRVLGWLHKGQVREFAGT